MRTREGDGTVTLSVHRGIRPVALVFGSYTCPPFRRALDELQRLHDRFADRVAFYLVYIKEAHPVEGWDLPGANRGVRVQDPTTEAERAAVAATCASRAGLRIPVVIDGMDDATAAAYGGWPDRLYLVGVDGRIAYQGGPGPHDVRPAELGAAIERELA